MKAKSKASLTSAQDPADRPAAKPASRPIIPGPSTNSLTNLVVADLVLRAGTRVLRHAIERGVLGTKYSPDQARKIVKSRSMVQTLVGTAVARVATGSVPGAILIGGALLAKTLYDRRSDRNVPKAKLAAEGEAQIKKQIGDA